MQKLKKQHNSSFKLISDAIDLDSKNLTKEALNLYKKGLSELEVKLILN